LNHDINNYNCRATNPNDFGNFRYPDLVNYMIKQDMAKTKMRTVKASIDVNSSTHKSLGLTSAFNHDSYNYVPRVNTAALTNRSAAS